MSSQNSNNQSKIYELKRVSWCYGYMFHEFMRLELKNDHTFVLNFFIQDNKDNNDYSRYCGNYSYKDNHYILDAETILKREKSYKKYSEKIKTYDEDQYKDSMKLLDHYIKKFCSYNGDKLIKHDKYKSITLGFKKRKNDILKIPQGFGYTTSVLKRVESN
jgi:hypothetical protein